MGDFTLKTLDEPAVEKPSLMSDIAQTIMGLPRTGAEGLSGIGGGIFDAASYLTGKGMGLAGYSDADIKAKQAEWDKDRWFANPAEVSAENTRLADEIGIPKGVEEASRYQPQTRTGQVVQTAGLLAPALLSGGGAAPTAARVLSPSNIAGRVGVPTLGIEGGAEVGKAMGDETMGRLLGGGVSMTAPALWNRFSRPYPAEPGRQPLTEVLDEHGVPYSAGQRTGNEDLLTRESVAGGTRAQREQPAAFTAASTRLQGGFPGDTNVATREAMAGELGRMGGEFDRLANISQAPFGPQLQNDLLDAVVRYEENPIIGTKVQNVVTGLGQSAAKNGGVITGEGYADTNSKISDIIRNTEDDAMREAFIDIKRILDDAVEQNLPDQERGNWRTVRQQYRDYLPIEKAKAGVSGAASRGVITPSALKTGIKAVEGAREVASGTRPLTRLAEAGTGIMEKTANSQTANRLRNQLAGIAPWLAASGAGALGAALGDPTLGAILGATTGGVSAAIPTLRNAYIASDIGNRMAGRQGPVFAPGTGPALPSVATAAVAPGDDRERLAAMLAMQRQRGDLTRR